MLNTSKCTGLRLTTGAMVASLMVSSAALVVPAYANTTPTNTHGSIQATGPKGPSDSMHQAGATSQQSMKESKATGATTTNTHGSIQATGATGY